MAKLLEDITNHSLNPANVFTIAVRFKANTSLCSNASQYSGATKASKKLASPTKKQIKKNLIRKNIFACLFSVHNTMSLSRHEQVCLMRLRFEMGEV